MRRTLIVALLAGLCHGCFVLEEIDKGQQLMEQHSPRARELKAQQEQAEAPPRTSAKQEAGTLEKLKQWWKKKREPAPPERDPSDVVVRCQIGGTTLFTRKSDCMLRGGEAI
jgi:hypothetical protein